jgi:hypothetical protein
MAGLARVPVRSPPIFLLFLPPSRAMESNSFCNITTAACRPLAMFTFSPKVDENSAESGPSHRSSFLEPSRMISLNLSDLRLSQEPPLLSNDSLLSLSRQDPRQSEEDLQIHLKDLEQYEKHYKSSLAVLLTKAQGTNYESILRRLSQDKENCPIDFDKEEFLIERRQQTDLSPRRSSLTFQSKTPQQQEKSSLAPVSASEQHRVDLILSKPLPRNMWQVTADYLLHFPFSPSSLRALH